MKTILDLWRNAVTNWPDKVAAIHEDREFTYAELDASVRHLAANLAERWRIGPGERVAILMPNCIEFVITYLAILHTGGTALTINIRLQPQEVEFILGDAQPSLWVVHKSTKKLADRLGNLPPSIKDTILVGLDDTFEALCAGHVGDIEPPAVAADDTAAIIYTSGTTGRPKGVMISHGNVVFNAASCLAGFGYEHDERHMLVVPLFHVTGLNTILPGTIRSGGTVVIAHTASPKEILALVERHRVNTFCGVPTTFIMMETMKGIEAMDLECLRMIGYSGAPMPIEAVRKLREQVPRAELHNFYGLTETTSMSTVLPSDIAVERADSIGLPVPNTELAILDDGGAAVPTGEIGELCLKGDNVFKGYFNRPDATRDSFVNGWFRTGDLATIDAAGLVTLQGRKKEMIIVGGENVYPVEVETIICSHPKVLEAAVVGIPHAVFGELVKAAVVPRPGETLTEAEIKKLCVQNLASFKVPTAVVFMESLPRNPSGKVVKRLI